jgi:hypothetical protein
MDLLYVHIFLEANLKRKNSVYINFDRYYNLCRYILLFFEWQMLNLANWGLGLFGVSQRILNLYYIIILYKNEN